MRYLFFLATLFCSIHAFGKNFCDKVEHKNDELRGYTVWHSPYKATVSISRYKYADGRDSLFLVVTLKIKAILDQEDKARIKGVYVLFSNGAHREPDAALATIPLVTGETGISGKVYLNEANVDSFSRLTITKVGLSGFEKEIPEKTALEIRQYLDCIRNAK